MGTVALSFLADTRLTLAATPPKLTVELLLKPIPLIVTTVPGAPLSRLRPITDSVGSNLGLLFTVTPGETSEIAPAFAPLGTVASISVGDSTVKLAASLPNSTALTAPRPLPSIWTALPVIPELGVKPLSTGRSSPAMFVNATSPSGLPTPVGPSKPTTAWHELAPPHEPLAPVTTS